MGFICPKKEFRENPVFFCFFWGSRLLIITPEERRARAGARAPMAQGPHMAHGISHGGPHWISHGGYDGASHGISHEIFTWGIPWGYPMMGMDGGAW